MSELETAVIVSGIFGAVVVGLAFLGLLLLCRTDD